MKYSESGKQKKKGVHKMEEGRVQDGIKWSQLCDERRKGGMEEESLRKMERKGDEVIVCECVSLSGWAEKYVKAINGWRPPSITVRERDEGGKTGFD